MSSKMGIRVGSSDKKGALKIEVTAEMLEEITRRVLDALGGMALEKNCPRALLLGTGGWSALRSRYALEGPDEYGQAKSLSPYAFVLLDGVSSTLLADLALGRGNCPTARAVSEALLTGKAIYLAEEGLLHRSCRRTAHPRYYAMLEEYVARLSQFGVNISPRAVLEQRLLAEEGTLPQPPKAELKDTACGEASTAGPGLLSADEARRLAKVCGGVLRLSPQTLVTPLARDVLREKKIRLIGPEEDAGC